MQNKVKSNSGDQIPQISELLGADTNTINSIHSFGACFIPIFHRECCTALPLVAAATACPDIFVGTPAYCTGLRLKNKQPISLVSSPAVAGLTP